MDIFSTLAGGLQVANSLVDIAKELRYFIHTVRFTPQEVQRFHGDLTIFASSLSEFVRLTRLRLQHMDGGTEKAQKSDKTKHVVCIIGQSEEVEMGFHRLLGRFFEDPERQPSAYRYMDRIRWYFRQNQVAGLRLSLESVKLSVMLFIQLDAYHDLVATVVKLKKENKEIPKELRHQLRLAKRQLKEQRAARRHAEEQLIQHHERTPSSETPLVAEISSIIKNTRSVERYAARTLEQEAFSIRNVVPSPSPTDSHAPSSSGSANTGRSSIVPRRPGPRPSNNGYFYSYTTNSAAFSDTTEATVPSPVPRSIVPRPRSPIIGMPLPSEEVETLEKRAERHILPREPDPEPDIVNVPPTPEEVEILDTDTERHIRSIEPYPEPRILSVPSTPEEVETLDRPSKRHILPSDPEEIVPPDTDTERYIRPSSPASNRRTLAVPSPEEIEIVDTHPERHIPPSDLNPKTRIESMRRPPSTTTINSEIIDPIIHDDGVETLESHNPWRGEASQLSAHSERVEPDTPAPLRHPKGSKLGKVPQQKNTALEELDSARGLWKEGSSPYKAVPPFRDADWKGVSRRPSG